MKKYILLILPLLFWLNSFSQSTNIGTFFHKKVKKGDYFFDQLAYRNALAVYLQKFNRDPKDHHVRERIAICYVKLHDPGSAELWYRSLSKEPDFQAETMLDYAEVLCMLAKYDDAKRWFQEYLKKKPGDRMALEKLNFLNDLARYTSNERFLISGFNFNTGHAEFGAHFFHNGVVFASSKDTELFIKHRPIDGVSSEESLLNLYYAEKNAMGDWGGFVPFQPKELRTRYHDGPMTFYNHFRKAAFTRTNLKKGKPVYDAIGRVNVGIHLATVTPAGAITNVTSFKYNSDGYSNAHPSFSRDGSVMYFSSTMPSGHGGSDIYYTTLVNDKWTDPVNLGDAINTRGDESYPFIANDTTLYFSSNGHGSLGGLDIYVIYKRNGKFIEPVNLGSPMNTMFDDFSLVCDSLGRTGYFSSNGEQDGGLDHIYGYVAKFYLLAGEVRELNRGDKTVSGVRISAYNGNGDLIDSARTDKDGRFILNLPFDQDFKIRGEKDGFETLDDLAFSTRGKPFGIDSLVLPLWKQNLFAKGRIFSNETQSLLPGVAVILDNVTDRTTDTLLVDQNGEYEFLVRPGKKYRIEGAKEGYIPNGFNLDTKGLVEGELLNDIVLEEIYMDKEVVLFDYDKDGIRQSAAAQLNEIVRTLKRYPRAIVNVAAHADSRGTFRYNMQLSKKRALSTQAYLASKGIAASRIHLSWFGEELVLNRCSDGVECPEEEHSKNRRGEVKVQREPID